MSTLLALPFPIAIVVLYFKKKPQTECSVQCSVEMKKQKAHWKKTNIWSSTTNPLVQGCQTHLHWGHISLVIAFKGTNVILGLYRCPLP